MPADPSDVDAAWQISLESFKVELGTSTDATMVHSKHLFR
jgi:hypothetical protein